MKVWFYQAKHVAMEPLGHEDVVASATKPSVRERNMHLDSGIAADANEILATGSTVLAIPGTSAPATNGDLQTTSREFDVPILVPELIERESGTVLTHPSVLAKAASIRALPAPADAVPDVRVAGGVGRSGDVARSGDVRPARRVGQADDDAHSHQWTRRYLALLTVIDGAAGIVGAASAFLIRLPEESARPTWTSHYAPATAALPLLWIAVLWFADAYDDRVLGLGAEEFQRVMRALVLMLALVGVGAYAGRIEVARGYVVIAVPLAALLTLLGRYVARKRLHRRRIAGEVSTSVLAAGDGASVLELVSHLHAQPHLGLRVAGACVLPQEVGDDGLRLELAQAGIEVLGDLDSMSAALRRAGADAVAVTSRAVTPRQLRELSWELERSRTELMVVPGLVEIAGPRLHIRPITGLPMLHIEKPEFSGAHRVVKAAFDRAASGLGLLLLSPLMIAVYVLIRATSSGPGFFRQTRVGKDGELFQIWKFRSMYVDAEQRLADYQALNEHVGGGMFKMRDDPRVTAVGRVIRRYSLDELPQLINVFIGTMSLVGPRPPLPSEVATYAFDARRRLLVRPGLTGLWQISGRSDLSWEETVRLDLRYVENWSLGQDALILWKTFATVVKGTGAY